MADPFVESPPPPLGKTVVVPTSDKRNVPTLNQETDARTALTRGMKEYIEQLSFGAIGSGRDFSFKRVFATWAEPEDEADYPSAAVYSDEPGEYDSSKFVGEPFTKVTVPGGGVYLVSSCEFVLPFMVDVWTTDPVERMGLVAMLEAALDPHDFRYGLLLELPHYFNQRATYEKMSMTYLDDEDSSQRRIRRAQIRITGRVPVTRSVTLPNLLARARTTTT